MRLYAQTNAPYPNRIQLVLSPTAPFVQDGPFIQTGPLGAFDPRRDLDVYVDGVAQTVQTFSFDPLNSRYLLFTAAGFNLQGTVQVVHHAPSPPFLYQENSGENAIDQTGTVDGTGASVAIGAITPTVAGEYAMFLVVGGVSSVHASAPTPTPDPSWSTFSGIVSGGNGLWLGQSLSTTAPLTTGTASLSFSSTYSAALLTFGLKTGSSFIGDIQTSAQTTTPNNGTTLAFSTPVTPGNAIMFVIIGNEDSTAGGTPTITDSDGNTYNTIINTHQVGGGSLSGSRVTVCIAQDINAGTPTLTIHAPWSNGTLLGSAYAVEITGLGSIVSTQQLPGFALVGSFSTEGDGSLPPQAQLIAVPSVVTPHQPVSLLWSTLNVSYVEITGNNSVDYQPGGFSTGLLSTSGSGIYAVTDGFTSDITLTLQAYNASEAPLVGVTSSVTITLPAAPGEFVQGTTAPGPDGLMVIGTFPENTTVGNLIFFVVTVQHVPTHPNLISVVSSSGVTYNAIFSAGWDTNSRVAATYWGFAMGGPETITVTFGSSFVDAGINAGEWTNNNPDPWTGAYNYFEGSDFTPGVTLYSGVITPPSNASLFGLYMTAEQSGVSIKDGSTIRVSNVGEPFVVSDYIISDGITYSPAAGQFESGAQMGLGADKVLLGIFAFVLKI